MLDSEITTPGLNDGVADRVARYVCITQAQLSLLLDVSRQRVSQMVREADEIPL